MKNGTVPEGDPGDFNARIIAKMRKSRLTRYEGDGLRAEIVLHSPEGKRLYARYFHDFQGNMYIMSTMALYQFPNDVTNDMYEDILQRIVKSIDEVEQEIAAAQKLFDANGVERPVDYADVPISVTTRIILAADKRYLQLILKTDQLMVMLDTLADANLVTSKQCATRKSHFKRAVRRLAGMVRAWEMERKAVRTAEEHARWPTGMRRRESGQSDAGQGELVKNPAISSATGTPHPDGQTDPGTR